MANERLISKFKLFLLSIIPALLIITIGVFLYINFSPAYMIKHICKNLKIIDANKDHNQALDVIEYSKKQGVEIPKTIINFDTHSDVYLFSPIDSKLGAQIYDWINEAFAKNSNTDELYWVMPEEEATNPKMQSMFIEKETISDIILYGNSQRNEKEVNPNINKYPYIQYFVVDTNTGYTKELTDKNSKPKNYSLDPKNPKYKKIKVITCTESSLPNFKNKKVLLSIDADYITNSGYDTPLNFSNDKNPQEIEAAIYKLLKTIHKKKISPEIISLTLSPHYVPNEDVDYMLNFFDIFIEHSGKRDIIQEYTRQFSSRRIKNGKKYKAF